MSMKKCLAVLMLAVLMLAMCACGTKESADNETTKDISANEAITETSVNEAEGSTEGESTENSKPEPTQTTVPPQESIVAEIEETVVYDSDDAKITVLELVQDVRKIGIKMRLENKTDKELGINVEHLVYNDITLSSATAFTAQAGQTEEAVLYVSKYELERSKITTITSIGSGDMELLDWNQSYRKICDLPFELTTTAAGKYTQKLDEDAKLLWEDENLSIKVSLGYKEGVLDNMEMPLLMIENHSDQKVRLKCEKILVNGTDVDLWSCKWFMKNTAGYFRFDFTKLDIKEAGIKKVDSLTFDLEIRWEDDTKTTLEDLHIDL